jgi:hypothetical protein
MQRGSETHAFHGRLHNPVDGSGSFHVDHGRESIPFTPFFDFSRFHLKGDGNVVKEMDLVRNPVLASLETGAIVGGQHSR